MQSRRDCNAAEEWVRVQLPAEEFLKGDGVLWDHGVVTPNRPCFMDIPKGWDFHQCHARGFSRAQLYSAGDSLGHYCIVLEKCISP